MKTILKFVSLSLMVGLMLAITSGNAQEEHQPVKTQSSPLVAGDCEGNNATLNVTHQTAATLGPESLIFAIAHLGSSERNRELNRRRLHNVLTYLTENWHRTPESVVTAEGDRVNGLGRVELYVGGKLFDVIAVKTNQDLSVGSCEPDNIRPKWLDRNLYPYLDRKSPKPPRKR